MTALVIVLGIALLIGLLLFLSLTVVVEASNSRTLLEARYAFFHFRLYDSLEQAEKKQKKQKKQKKRPVAKEGTNGKKRRPAEKEKRSLSEWAALIHDLIYSVCRGSSRLWRKIRVEGLEVSMVAGGEDACQAALNYGKISAAVYTVLGALKSLLSVSVKAVEIQCDFDAPTTCYRLHAKVKVRIFVLIAAAVRMAYHFLAHTYRRRSSEKAEPQVQQPQRAQA